MPKFVEVRVLMSYVVPADDPEMIYRATETLWDDLRLAVASDAIDETIVVVDMADRAYCDNCGHEIIGGSVCLICNDRTDKFVSYRIGRHRDETDCDHCGNGLHYNDLAYYAADNKDAKVYCSVGCGEAAYRKDHAETGGGTHCPECNTELAEPGPCWVCSDPLD